MQSPGLDKAQIYTEFEGLNALKTQARTDKRGALEQVAKQFESLFVAEMLKSMRSANKVLSEGNYLNSNESEFYQEMFDSQLSQSMSQQGLGLADALVSQLSRQIPGMTEEGDKAPVHKGSIADYSRSLPPMSAKLPQQVAALDRELARMQRNDMAPEPASAARPAPGRFDSQQAFIEHLLPLAEEVAGESGIDPKLMLAQAALETGWGKHMIEQDGEASHNLFGIKADARWQGESMTVGTTEFREGVAMSERASFRAYPDYAASFRDYVAFLENNPRYRDVLAVADDPEQFAQKLQQAGYATDPNYSDKIRRIMGDDALNIVPEPSVSLQNRGTGE